VFLKQNRNIAKSHSMLNTKVTQLEEAMARLRTENLELRKENIILRKRNEKLQNQLGTNDQVTSASSDLNELAEIERYQIFYRLMEEKFIEFNQVFGLLKGGQTFPLYHNTNGVMIDGQQALERQQREEQGYWEHKREETKEIMISGSEDEAHAPKTPQPESVDSFVNKSRRKLSRRRESGLIQSIPNLTSSDEEKGELGDQKELLPIEIEEDEEDAEEGEDEHQNPQILEIAASIPEEPESDSEDSFKYVPVASRKHSAIKVLRDDRPASQSPRNRFTTATATLTSQKSALLSQKQINSIHNTASSTSPTKIPKTHQTQKKTSPKENDIMPISTNTGSNEDMRQVRRRRRSNTVTNYALPSLRQKMRREKDSLTDAVSLKKRKLADHDTDPIII
jgi:regulator of replication initiation timing